MLKVNAENKSGGKLVEVEEDLYLNADRSALVPAGPDARFLFARAGRKIRAAELEAFKPKAKPRGRKKRSVKADG